MCEMVNRVSGDLDLSPLLNIDEDRMQRQDQLAFFSNVVEEMGRLGLGFRDFEAGRSESTSRKIRYLQRLDILSQMGSEAPYTAKESRRKDGDLLWISTASLSSLVDIVGPESEH